LFAVCLVLGVAGFYVDPTWTARQFVTGQNNSEFGPVGLIFDSHNHFFYTDGLCVYRIDAVFPWSGTPYTDGGAAKTLCNLANGGAWVQDLAFDGLGRLWAGNPSASFLIQIDPVTLTQLNSMPAGAGSSAGILGIAQHAQSGDLFWCARGNGTWRYSITTNTITKYSSNCGDGIAFDTNQDILYADGSVYRIQGPASGATPPVPETQSFGAGTCDSDGIAVSSDNKYIYTNCNNGGQVIQITRSDDTVKQIFSDTYRGDFCVVGPDGCIYFTHETDSIWQLCPKNVTLLPTPTGNPPTDCGTGYTSVAVDFNGCDLASTNSSGHYQLSPSIAWCSAYCSSYPGCNGFTFDLTGETAVNHKYGCWFKNIACNQQTGKCNCPSTSICPSTQNGCGSCYRSTIPASCKPYQ